MNTSRILYIKRKDYTVEIDQCSNFSSKKSFKQLLGITISFEAYLIVQKTALVPIWCINNKKKRSFECLVFWFGFGGKFYDFFRLIQRHISMKSLWLLKLKIKRTLFDYMVWIHLDLLIIYSWIGLVRGSFAIIIANNSLAPTTILIPWISFHFSLAFSNSDLLWHVNNVVQFERWDNRFKENVEDIWGIWCDSYCSTEVSLWYFLQNTFWAIEILVKFLQKQPITIQVIETEMPSAPITGYIIVNWETTWLPFAHLIYKQA